MEDNSIDPSGDVPLDAKIELVEPPTDLFDAKDDLLTTRDGSFMTTRDAGGFKASWVKTIMDVHGGIENWLMATLQDAIPKDLYSMYINKNNILFAHENGDDSRESKWIQDMTESYKRSILASFDTVTHYTNLTCRSEAHRKRIAFDYKTDPSFLRVVEPKTGRYILSNLIKCAAQQHKGLVNYVEYVQKNISSMPLLEELNRFALTQKIAYKSARERLWFVVGLAEELKLVERGKTFKRASTNAKDGISIDRVALDKEITLKWFNGLQRTNDGRMGESHYGHRMSLHNEHNDRPVDIHNVQNEHNGDHSTHSIENIIVTHSRDIQSSISATSGSERAPDASVGISSGTLDGEQSKESIISGQQSFQGFSSQDSSSTLAASDALLQGSSILNLQTRGQFGMSDAFAMDNSVSFLGDGNVPLLGNESVPFLGDTSMSILANDSMSLFVDKNNEPISGFTSLGIGEMSTPNTKRMSVPDTKNAALLSSKRSHVDSFDENFMNLIESPSSFFRLDQLSDQTKNSLNESQGTSWQALQMMKRTKNRPDESKGKHTMKEALDKFVKKKANYAFKNAISTISVLEAASKLYGKGPKWCNPNRAEFDVSNKDRKLVYVMPSKAVKPNDLAYQYLMQYASVHQKLNGGIRQEHAILYGIITLDSLAQDVNKMSIKSFKVNADPWHDKRYAEKWSKLSESINGYTPWFIRSHVLVDQSKGVSALGTIDDAPVMDNDASDQNGQDGMVTSPSRSQVAIDENGQNEETTLENEHVVEATKEMDEDVTTPEETPSDKRTIMDMDQMPAVPPDNSELDESPLRLVKRDGSKLGVWSNDIHGDHNDESDRMGSMESGPSETTMEPGNAQTTDDDTALVETNGESVGALENCTIKTSSQDDLPPPEDPEKIIIQPKEEVHKDAWEKDEVEKLETLSTHCPDEEELPRVKLEREDGEPEKRKNYDAPGPVKISDTGMKQMKLTHLFRYVYTKIKKAKPLPECSPDLLGLPIPKQEPPLKVEHAVFGKKRKILDDDHVPDVLASDYVKIDLQPDPSDGSQDAQDLPAESDASPGLTNAPKQDDSEAAKTAAFMAKLTEYRTAQDKKANRKERIHRMREIMKSMIEYEAVESDDENLSDPEDIKRSLELLKNRLLHSSDESDSEPESETEIAMEMKNFIQEVENVNEEDEEIARQRFYEDMKAKEENELAKLMAFKEKGEREMTRREERMKLLMELKNRRRNSADDLHLSDFESSSDEDVDSQDDEAPRLSKQEIKQLLGFKDKEDVKLSQTDELERFIDFKLQNLPQPVEESSTATNLGNAMKNRRDMMDNMFSSGFDMLFSNMDPDCSSSIPMNPFGSSAMQGNSSASNLKSPKKNAVFVMKSFRWDQSQTKPLNSTNIR